MANTEHPPARPSAAQSDEPAERPIPDDGEDFAPLPENPENASRQGDDRENRANQRRAGSMNANPDRRDGFGEAGEGGDHPTRRRAYEIWEREGRPEGRHEDHWRHAEYEIGRADPKFAPARPNDDEDVDPVAPDQPDSGDDEDSDFPPAGGTRSAATRAQSRLTRGGAGTPVAV